MSQPAAPASRTVDIRFSGVKFNPDIVAYDQAGRRATAMKVAGVAVIIGSILCAIFVAPATVLACYGGAVLLAGANPIRDQRQSQIFDQVLASVNRNLLRTDALEINGTQFDLAQRAGNNEKERLRQLTTPDAMAREFGEAQRAKRHLEALGLSQRDALIALANNMQTFTTPLILELGVRAEALKKPDEEPGPQPSLKLNRVFKIEVSADKRVQVSASGLANIIEGPYGRTTTLSSERVSVVYDVASDRMTATYVTEEEEALQMVKELAHKNIVVKHEIALRMVQAREAAVRELDKSSSR